MKNDGAPTKRKSTPMDQEKEKTVDAYMASLPEDVRPLLDPVRKKLQEVLPEARERISWGMPTYWQEHNIIHFAAHKKHMGLYPGVEAMKHFADRLKGFKTSKGAIQFQYSEPIPLKLIGDIARWCYETGYHH